MRLTQALRLGRAPSSPVFFLVSTHIASIISYKYTRIYLMWQIKDPSNFVDLVSRHCAFALSFAEITMRSHFISKPDGSKIHYQQSGDPEGTLLICLHGLGGSTATFTPLVPHLPQDHNIILLDFPGFGKSPPPSQCPTITGLVSDLQNFIKSVQETRQGAANNKSKVSVKICQWTPQPKTFANNSPLTQKVIIIGHSLGTVIALHFTAQHPSFVSGLVLLGVGRSASHIPFVRQRMLDMATNTRQNGISWAAELASTSNFPPSDKRTVEANLRQEVKSQVAGSDPETYALICEMMVDETHKDPEYGVIECPIVLVAGDLDLISPVDRSTGLVKLLGSKNAWTEVVVSGHQLILEDVNGVMGAVGRLLQAVASGA